MMDRWMDNWMDRWLNGQMAGRLNRQIIVDRWMDGCLHGKRIINGLVNWWYMRGEGEGEGEGEWEGEKEYLCENSTPVLLRHRPLKNNAFLFIRMIYNFVIFIVPRYQSWVLSLYTCEHGGVWKRNLCSPLTGICDVETSASGGVIRLKLQAYYVSTAGQLCRHLIARESSEDCDVRNPIIFDGKEVKLRFHIEIIEDEVNPAPRLRYNQPHTVHVVAILLRIVWREDDPRGCREVEETWNCGHMGIFSDSSAQPQSTVIWTHLQRTWDACPTSRDSQYSYSEHCVLETRCSPSQL